MIYILLIVLKFHLLEKNIYKSSCCNKKDQVSNNEKEDLRTSKRFVLWKSLPLEYKPYTILSHSLAPRCVCKYGKYEVFLCEKCTFVKYPAGRGSYFETPCIFPSWHMISSILL